MCHILLIVFNLTISKPLAFILLTFCKTKDTKVPSQLAQSAQILESGDCLEPGKSISVSAQSSV